MFVDGSWREVAQFFLCHTRASHHSHTIGDCAVSKNGTNSPSRDSGFAPLMDAPQHSIARKRVVIEREGSVDIKFLASLNIATMLGLLSTAEET